MFNLRKGISLISLMVIIIVLGILAVVAIPNIKDIADDTRLSATLENKTNVQKSVDRYLLEKQELPVEKPGDLKIGEPQQVKWDLLSPDYLREKPADLDKIYYWVDYNGTVFASDIDAPQNITINTVLGTTTVTWDEVDGAKSYEIGYIDNSLISEGLSRDLKALNASTGSYKVLGIVNSEDALSFDTTDDLTGKTIVLSSISESFKSVPVKVGYIGSELELEAVEGENIPSGPQPLQTEVPDGWIGIYTVEDLDNMRNNLSGKYILMNNLDLNDYYTESITEWTPFPIFYGDFDGNGLFIDNLNIPNSGGDRLGLFSVVSGSEITNLTLKNVNISGYSNVGGISGESKGGSLFKRVKVEGTLYGYSNAGGIVGYLSNNYSYSIPVFDEVVFKGSIKNVRYYGGGFIGYAGTSLIKNSYVEGVITGSNDTTPVVGYNGWGSTEIQNSYVNVDYTWYGSSKNGGLDDRYSYWNMNASTSSFSDLYGRTDIQMKTQSTYVNWNFDSIWSIDEGNDYPRLQWENK